MKKHVARDMGHWPDTLPLTLCGLRVSSNRLIVGVFDYEVVCKTCKKIQQKKEETNEIPST